MILISVKKISRLVLYHIVTFSLYLISSAAVSAEVAEDRFILNGNITLNSISELQSRIKDDKPLHAIEFRESRGSNSSATIILESLSEIIVSQNLKTYARGRCASSCAEAFLMGERKTLLPSNSEMPTHLMIHAAYSGRNGEVIYGDSERSFKKIVARSGGKIQLPLLEKVFETKSPNGGIFIFRDPFTTIYGKYNILFCKGDEKFAPRTCEPIKDLTLQSLGISIEN
ncbi:hypothetical protein UNDYM_0516 [Undibacterium sp. YM2]|uniref:hypothetical protein n=1 Tax=Undibacterium sp. YM2 TaxID=2058625 RepID=UPI001331C55E|nr:hypothetical protein [Undibacterium sp. YM2]BBB64769.1 hypothetical protein UNDYM_0516 [Undibacterium sp. YM2]